MTARASFRGSSLGQSATAARSCCVSLPRSSVPDIRTAAVAPLPPLAAAGDAVGTPRLVCAAPHNHEREGIAVRRWQDATSQ